MVAQWTQSGVRPLRRFSSSALFLLALGGNKTIRRAIERELDLRRKQTWDRRLPCRFSTADRLTQWRDLLR